MWQQPKTDWQEGEYFNIEDYNRKRLTKTELEKLPIQKQQELLMVYTCYPFNNFGYTTQRYVVYAELE